jgi:hypothetical protein
VGGGLNWAPAGTYEGETGLVTSVDESSDVVTLFTDTGKREIRAFSHDLIESEEISSGRDRLGDYILNDLVRN